MGPYNLSCVLGGEGLISISLGRRCVGSEPPRLCVASGLTPDGGAHLYRIRASYELLASDFSYLQVPLGAEPRGPYCLGAMC